MRGATWICAGLLVAACTRPSESAAPALGPPPPAGKAAVTLPALAREGIDATQASERTAEVTFTPATSGTCEPLRVLPHGRDAYLFFGRTTLVQLLPDGSFKDLRLRETLDDREEVVAVVAGAGEEIYVRTHARRPGVFYSRYFRRHAGAWTSLDEEMQRNIEDLAPWLDGGVLATGSCHRDNPGACGGGLVVQAFGGTAAAPSFPELSAPAACGEFKLAADEDGRILASGGLCRGDGRTRDDTWTVVRWSPADGAMVTQAPMPVPDWYPGPLAIGPTHMFAAAEFRVKDDVRASVAVHDGAAWTQLPPVAGEVQQIAGDAEGRPWVRTSAGLLKRYTAAGRWERLAFPTGPVGDFGGLQSAWAWVLQVDGTLWLRRSGGKFARASLRRPEFGARELPAEGVALAGEALWVTVRYSEENPCVLLLRGADGAR